MSALFYYWFCIRWLWKNRNWADTRQKYKAMNRDYSKWLWNRKKKIRFVGRNLRRQSPQYRPASNNRRARRQNPNPRKVQEWHTCDVCGERCEPVGIIEIPFAYSMDLVYTVRVSVSAYLPYGTTNGDVCFNCFKKHIQKWIAEQERKGRQP